MLHQLPIDRKLPRLGAAAPGAPRVFPRMVEIPAGAATLGIRRGDGPFGWDNEFEQHRVEVPAFRVDGSAVTNGDFLRFVETGGYRQPRSFWTDADWAWIQSSGVSPIRPSGLPRERRMGVPHDVRRSTAALGLAGVREPRRG